MYLQPKQEWILRKLFDAIKGGLAGSTVLNAKSPMVLEGNYKPGFRIELHIKDLQNALDTAHETCNSCSTYSSCYGNHASHEG